MCIFVAVYLLLIAALNHQSRAESRLQFAALLFSFFPPVTQAYSTVLQAHPYFLLSNWHWYEWTGIAACLAVLASFSYLAVTESPVMESMDPWRPPAAH